MTRSIAREGILQRHVKLFVRDAVTAPHEFFAFDRAKAAGRFSHMREAGRGVRKGTPDTLLLVLGYPPVWVELKAPGGKPDAAQLAVGEALRAVGCRWEWCTTVLSYCAILAEMGVPMARNATVQAMQHDGAVASLIAQAELKRGDAPKAARKPKAVPRYSATGKRAARMAGVGQ